MSAAVPGIDVFSTRGVNFAAFDPSWLGVWAEPLSASHTKPHSPSEALAMSGAKAVLDGPMFEHCSGGDSDVTSQCDVIRFLQFDASRGLSFGGDSPRAGVTISVVGGRAVAASGASPASGASVAVQLYPALVLGGRNVASNASGTNGNSEGRAGLAILSDGRVAFCDGFLDMEGFANALISVGATDAGYTDGGGSTALWLEDGTMYGASEHRRVATWLTASPSGLLGIPASGWFLAAGAAVVVGSAALVYRQFVNKRKHG